MGKDVIAFFVARDILLAASPSLRGTSGDVDIQVPHKYTRFNVYPLESYTA